MKRKITFLTAAFVLLAFLVPITGWGQTRGTEVTYDFSQIPGFDTWGTSYSEHVVEYDDATVTFASANHQTSTITDIPVTKGQPVSLVLNNTEDYQITEVTFVCRQWGTKTQTITLHYSTDGGSTYTSTDITSTNFTITSSSLDAGTNAVKITFSSSNQVGIASCTYTLESIGGTPTPSITINSENIEFTAAESEVATTTVTYTNLDERVSAIALYEDVECTNSVTGLDNFWFTAVFATDDDETIEYFAAENEGTEPRTVYMRVEATEGEEVYTSNVITVTQAAPVILYTVSFELGGGTFVPNSVFTDDVVELEAGTYALPSATKANHIFVGWNDGTTTYAAGVDYTVSGDVEFTAQYVLGVMYNFAGANNFYTDEALTTHPGSGNGNNVGTIYYGDGSMFVATGTNRYFSSATSGYFMLGKSGAKLSLPTFNGYKITQVKLHSSTNHSKSVRVSIVAQSNQEVTASDAQTWETNDNDYTYNIREDYQEMPLSVKVENSYNTQFVSITLVLAAGSTDPRINANDVSIDFDVVSGNIAYDIINPVNVGVLTATTDDEWLTLGTIGTTVPFSCTPNTAYTARTATVTLTYTYGEESVTKDVTITQGAVPEPSFTLAPEAVNVSADGGQCAVVFTLANVSGTIVAINTYFDPGQPEWIPNNGGINYTTLANISLSPLEMDSIYMDSIYITVDQNNTIVSRSVEIWMSIMINGSYTQIASNRVTITQAAPEAPHYTWDLTTNSYASASADSVIWSSDYAMMIIEKHQSSTAANNYLGGGSNNQTRFYQDQKLTFTPNSGYAVDSIVINATSAGYGEGFTGNDWTNATASTNGTVITVVPTDGDEPFSVVISKACRATGVTVYYRTSTTNVYYNITLSYGEHGIITSDKTTAREGDIVIIAVIPDEYYYASAFGFAFSVGSSLDYEVIEPNVYRVIMPACDLSVSATFDTYYDLHTITIDEGIENGTVVADKVEAPENTLITLTVTPAAGYILEDNNLIVVANTANVEVTKVNATTYTFEMPAENVTVTAEFTAIPPTTYTRATYIQSGRHYIIVGFNGDDAYAMGQQNNYNRAAVAISVDGNVATVNSTDGVCEFVINDVAGVKKTPFANPTENVYVQRTIYDPASSGYLYAASSGSNYLKTETHLDANDNALWYVTQDYSTGIATVVAYGANTKNRMRYNSASNVFSCYGANNTQQDVYLYVKDEETPTFDFYKDVKGYGTSEGGYCLIATPTNDAANPSVVGMITDDGSNPEGFTYDLYGFDFTQDQEWRNYRSAAFNMNNGQGYLYANKSSVTLHFQGAPYTNNPSQGGGTWFGSLSKEVTLQFDENNNHTFNGFNLVGNPLSIFAGVDRDFYVMNVDGTEVELAERAYVNPMEGVFVKATEANQKVLFEEWIQPDEWGFDDLGVRVSGDNGSSDFARIRFGEGRNLEKFMLNQNHTKLYFTQGNKDFAVVRSANEGEMPVSFKAETNGNYTISVNTENVNMSYLHLIDNVTGADVDLLATPSYSFEANTNDYATRFRLVFKANANVPENADADTFAFFNGNEWVVSNVGEATLQVVDVMGRVLSSETINGNAEISIKQEPGVYMLRLINGDNVKTQKVVVK